MAKPSQSPVTDISETPATSCAIILSAQDDSPVSALLQAHFAKLLEIFHFKDLPEILLEAETSCLIISRQQHSLRMLTCCIAAGRVSSRHSVPASQTNGIQIAPAH